MQTFTLEELFRDLSFGELSNLAAGLDGAGTVSKGQQNTVVSYINDALVQLHARLPLIEETAQIPLNPEEDTLIELDPDVLYVTQLVTPYGQSLCIETRPVKSRIYVHQHRLHIPNSIYQSGIKELQATYQKRHPVIAPVFGHGSDDGDPETPDGLLQEIRLIPELREALTAYVAYRLYSMKNTQEALAIAAGYRQRYEEAVTTVLSQGLVGGETLPSKLLERRGFV